MAEVYRRSLQVWPHHRLPKVGEKVTPHGKGGTAAYPNGKAVGKVLGIIAGACGPIVVVDFPGYGTVDLFWKKLRRM